jgi:RimJ/RimL family protein N-acetyltransferase
MGADLSQQGTPRIEVEPGLIIRPLHERDVTDAYVTGLNDASVSAFLTSAGSTRQTRVTVSDFVRASWEAPDGLLFGMFLKDRHIGNIRLHDITPEEAIIGVAIFDAGCHGKGIGTKVIAKVAEFALNDLGVEQVTCGVNSSNVASRRAFENAGFRVFDRKAAPGSLWLRRCR